MSQFRGDNLGPLHPMQKTLTSFVISGEDVTRKFTPVENSTSLQMSDKHVMLDGELNSLTGDGSCFSNDDHYLNIPYVSDVMTESNQLMQPTDSMSNDVHGINNTHDACQEKVCSLTSVSSFSMPVISAS